LNIFLILDNIYYKANKDFKTKNKKYLFTIKEKGIYTYKTLEKEKGNSISGNNNGLLALLI